MSETPHTLIHQLRNQLRSLDANIFRLYLVDNEFDNFARPILHWFINRPEIISVLDATDILTTSFTKRYGGTPDFWHAYIAVSNEEMQSAAPANTQLNTPETAAPAPATPEHAPLPSVTGHAAMAETPHAAPHAAEQSAAQGNTESTVNSGTAGTEAPEPSAPEPSAPEATLAAGDSGMQSEPQEQERPTSPLQGATTPRQRVRAKTPTGTVATPAIPAAPVSLVAVSAAADHTAERTETPTVPGPGSAAPTMPEPKVAAASADKQPATTKQATPAPAKPNVAHSNGAASKSKKTAAHDEEKPVAAFVPEPERERLFDEIRVTLDGMMKKYQYTQFKDLAEKVTAAAEPHKPLSVPVSILYALHSKKYFRKENRTYVTSQATALNILRLLRHMKNPKSGHLRISSEEIMAEFRTAGSTPVLPAPSTSLIASN